MACDGRYGNTRMIVTQFKDKMGRYLTQSLFLELLYDTDAAIYTLQDREREYKGKIYPSIHQAYLEMADPTEYSFAMKYFHSWQHWLKISNAAIIKPHIEKWRDELEVMLRSQGIRKLIKTSEGNSKDSVSASRWLADRGWNKRKAGAPSKEEVIRQQKIAASIESEIEKDAKRILRIVND